VVSAGDDSNIDYHHIFENYYQFVRKEKYDLALNELVNKQWRIRKKYMFAPNHVWYCVGSVFFRMGDYEKSIKFYLKALREQHDDMQSLFALGNSYSEMKLHFEAASCFFLIMKIDPKNVDAKFNYSGSIMDMGFYEKALYVLRTILKKDKKINDNISYCVSRLKADY
jgi:tetratricopeptide (TPR) repeat protein